MALGEAGADVIRRGPWGRGTRDDRGRDAGCGPLGRGGGAGRHRPGGDGDAAGSGGASGRVGELGRHGAARACAGYRRGRLRRGHGGQRQGGLCPRAGPVARADGRARARSFTDLQPDGPCGRHRPRRLLRQQARGRRHDESHGDRMGRPGHPGEHDLPHVHPHPADRKHLRRSGEGARGSRTRSSSAAWGGSRTSWGRWSFSPRTHRRWSRGRR